MPTITSAYAGEVLDAIKTKLATGNEAVQRGLINVIPEIRYKTLIPRMKVDNLIGPRVEQPTTSYGTAAITEKALQPTDIMLYHEFNPRAFEAFWMPYQPDGHLVFRELPVEIQQAFLLEIAKFAGTWFGRNIWQGNTGGANVAPYNNLMNGIITRAAADADVIDIATPVTLTAGNIAAKVGLVYDATPVAVRNSPNYRILLSDTSAELYADAVIAQTNKGNDFTQASPLFYKGKTIERLVGMPDDTIFATHMSADVDSNIHFGVDWDLEAIDTVLIDKVTNAGEKYFVKFLLKGDTQIAFGEECVLYQV